jgi:zinc ribbon protein
MFCLRCGQQVPDTATFCPACGQPTNQPLAPVITSPAPPPPVVNAAAGSNLKGVGGWLLLFCVGFTILWPIWTVLQYAATILLVHFRFNPLFLLGLFRLVFEIVVGVVLWTGKPVAMVLLRIYFSLAGLLTLWGIVGWIMIILRFSRAFESIGSIMSLLTLVLHVVFLVSAIAYFSMSERVKATYGSKLFS